MVRAFLSVLFVTFMIRVTVSPPVLEKKKDDEVKPPGQSEDDMTDTNLQNLEYHRYLQEVVSVLEGDPEVRKRLEQMSADDIKSGKAAEHLDFAGEHVRSKLNEIKRREIDRLRRAIDKHVQEGRQNEIKLPEHLDHSKHEFEKDDLKKLIAKTHSDLDALDKLRTEEFKKHEMKKEVQYREKVAEAKTEEEWKQVVEQHEKERKAQKDHPKVHQPGSKAQLEEVWEESDHMSKDSFDMKTFFNLHDVDSNGYLDQSEIEALLQKELDKVYNSKEEGYDATKREEEEARMREHVIKEMDKDNDGLISYEEFLGEENDPDFEKDEDWDTLDDQDDPSFNEDELKSYEEEYDERHGRPATYLPPVDIAHPPSFRPPAGAPAHLQDINSIDNAGAAHSQENHAGGDSLSQQNQPAPAPPSS